MFKRLKSYVKKQFDYGTTLLSNQSFYNRDNYDQQKYAREGYVVNCIFQACVKKIANQALTIPLCFKNKMNDEEVENKMLEELLKRPNPAQSYQAFLTNLFIDYSIFGDIFIQVGEDNKKRQLRDNPAMLKTLRPFSVYIETDTNNEPIRYKYNTVKGHVVYYGIDRLGRSQILHIKTVNPLENPRGVSPLQACAISVDQHNMAGAWNVSLLEKGAMPTLVIRTDLNMTEEQKEEFYNQFYQKNSGFKNAGKIPIINDKAEIDQLGYSPADMDWLSGYEVAMRNICLTLGVPVDLMFGQSTYENLKTANEQLAENTTIPLMRHFIGEFNERIVPLFDENIYIDLKLDSMPALMQKRDSLRDSLENNTFMTINEKREALGLEALDGGDELLVGAGMIPISDLTAPLEAVPVDE